MTEADRERGGVVAGWWQYQRLSSGTRLQRKGLERGEPSSVVAASDAVHEQISRGGPDALTLVEALVDAAANDDDLALVGAGPLEDLLVDHGSLLVNEIDDRARKNPRFAEALSGVWWSSVAAGPVVTARLARWVPALRRD